MTPIREGGVMTAWTPPKIYYFEDSDGNLLAIDEQGKPLDCQPTLTTQVVDGTESVLDPWGNVVEEYELPPYTIHVVDGDSPSSEWIGVAVDADGVPLPLVPNVKVTSMYAYEPYQADVVLPDGTHSTLPTYGGPEKYYVHVEWSSTRMEAGTPEYELVAVDASGVPLASQPAFYFDPTDPSTMSANWAAGSVDNPPLYEFPEFSVHLEYPDGAFRGAGAAGPVPIAVGADGKPLPTQPHFEADPTDPTNVVAILPNGDKYDAPAYEFPQFQVHLEYPEGSYSGHAAPIPTAIAVDRDGVPLAVQPHLEVDPDDHKQVTATLSDFTTTPVEVQPMVKDFFVFVEASGPATEHGAATFVAVAVDANGTPLPIQPHFQDLDPSDLTNVKAVFPDGSIYEPPPLYPPPGETPDEWPPDPWPLPEAESSEDEGSGTDDVVGADSADDLDASADGADAAEEAVEDEDGADESQVPAQEGTEDATPTAGDESTRSYTGVVFEEGEVLVDEDWSGTESEAGTIAAGAPDDLLTVGLVDAAPGGDVSATPITLPGEAMPVGDEVVSATPITLPDEVPPLGDEVSLLPIPIPVPPTAGGEGAGEVELDDKGDDQIALDRKGGDKPVDISVDETSADVAVEFRVEVVEEVQVEEVLLEDVELGTMEPAAPIVELEELALDEEGIDELDT